MRWLVLLLFVGGCSTPLLLREAEASERGREALAEGDAAAAKEAYDPVALGLPDGPDVALGLGLAALAEGDHDAAIAWFEAALAEEPLESRLASTAEPLLRRAYRLRDALLRREADERFGRAYQNVGVAHLREGDLARERGDHVAAKKAYEAAVDAFERSLVVRPGDRDTAFDLELALLRQAEAELMPPPPQPEPQEGEQDQDAEGEEGEERDQDASDSEQGEDEDRDQDAERPRGDEDESQGDGSQGAEDAEPAEPEEDDDARAEGDEAGGDTQDDAEGEREASDDAETREAEAEPIEAEERDEAERVLRALEEGDETLESHLAKRRAARRRRIVEKDW